jgi:hypothetical protein
MEDTKKTEQLSLYDLRIGDYIQEWREIPGVFSMPMYVSCIFDDGDLYLNFDGNEADPWDANVKDVYDIPIDWGILPHFGFFEEDHHLFELEQGDWMVMVHVLKICNIFHANVMLSNKMNGKAVLLGCVYSIRELQHKFYDETKEPLKLTFE